MVGHFKARPRFKVTFRANVYGPLDGGMVILQFAAGRFHTKKLCSRLYSTEIGFCLKSKTKTILRNPLGDLAVTYAFHL